MRATTTEQWTLNTKTKTVHSEISSICQQILVSSSHTLWIIHITPGCRSNMIPIATLMWWGSIIIRNNSNSNLWTASGCFLLSWSDYYCTIKIGTHLEALVVITQNNCFHKKLRGNVQWRADDNMKPCKKRLPLK